MTLTIDASVWVAARFENEPGHAASATCLLDALASREPIVLPLLAWVECVAAVARKTDDETLAHEVGRHLRDLPAVHWAIFDEADATDATDIAAACRLRAADAVYVSVAHRHRATLLTFDRELRQRCAAQVRCLSPEEWSRSRGSTPAGDKEAEGGR